LIEKIRKEGIETARNKAKEIEAAAQNQVAQIIAQAKQDAKKIISEAEATAKKTQSSTAAALSQSARDMLLGLRKEIEAMLMRLVAQKVREALTPAELGKIIHACVKENAAKAKEEIIISLAKADAHKLEGLLDDLKHEVRHKIVISPSEEIQAGFTISFDRGKSQFDFSDKALAEYIGSFLKPKLQEILKTATA
jgi:vacuolar-type H+-ATPase subunit E/Vma4